MSNCPFKFNPKLISNLVKLPQKISIFKFLLFVL